MKHFLVLIMLFGIMGCAGGNVTIITGSDIAKQLAEDIANIVKPGDDDIIILPSSDPDPDPDPDPLPNPDPDPLPDPPVTDPKKLVYSHYNPNGNVCGGTNTSSFVICKDQEWYDSCEISGVELDKHSGLNKGKKVYKKCNVPNLAGTVTCKKDGKMYTAQVNATGLQYGGCY